MSTRRVGVIQSCYLPWRGYFDFIASVDLFVIYDCVQYSSGSWRNRNQVKTAQGLKWITVPVTFSLGVPIDAVEIAHGKKPWQEEHRRLLTASLSGTPYFQDAMGLWEAAIAHGDTRLTDLNTRLLRAVCERLRIATPLVSSRDYPLEGGKTDRLLQLLRAVGATHYLSGPAARAYLDEDAFRREGIALEYKSYDYAPYPQGWGEFHGAVSILDLIANTGPAAPEHLRSRTADVVAVPPPERPPA